MPLQGTEFTYLSGPLAIFPLLSSHLEWGPAGPITGTASAKMPMLELKSLKRVEVSELLVIGKLQETRLQLVHREQTGRSTTLDRKLTQNLLSLAD